MQRQIEIEDPNNTSLSALIIAIHANDISYFLSTLEKYQSHIPTEQFIAFLNSLANYAEKFSCYKVVSALHIITHKKLSPLAAVYFHRYLGELSQAFQDNAWAQPFRSAIPQALPTLDIAPQLELFDHWKIQLHLLINTALSNAFLSEQTTLAHPLSTAYKLLFATNNRRKIAEECCRFLATSSDTTLLSNYWSSLSQDRFMRSTEDKTILKRVFIALGKNPRIKAIITTDYVTLYELIKKLFDHDPLSISCMQTFLALGVDISIIANNELTNRHWKTAFQDLIDCGWQPHALLSELWDQQRRDYRRFIDEFYSSQPPIELVIEACAARRRDKLDDYFADTQNVPAHQTYHLTIQHLRNNHWYSLIPELNCQIDSQNLTPTLANNLNDDGIKTQRVFSVLMNYLEPRDIKACIIASRLARDSNKTENQLFRSHMASERKVLLDSILLAVKNLQLLEKEIWRYHLGAKALISIYVSFNILLTFFSTFEFVCAAHTTCSTEKPNTLTLTIPGYCPGENSNYDIDYSTNCINYINKEDLHKIKMSSPMNTAFNLFLGLAGVSVGVLALSWMLFRNRSRQRFALNSPAYRLANFQRLNQQIQATINTLQRQRALLTIRPLLATPGLRTSIDTMIFKLNNFATLITPNSPLQSDYVRPLKYSHFDDSAFKQALIQYRASLLKLPLSEWQAIFHAIGVTKKPSTLTAEPVAIAEHPSSLWKKRPEQQPLLDKNQHTRQSALEAGTRVDSDDDDARITVAPATRVPTRTTYGSI